MPAILYLHYFYVDTVSGCTVREGWLPSCPRLRQSLLVGGRTHCQRGKSSSHSGKIEREYQSYWGKIGGKYYWRYWGKIKKKMLLKSHRKDRKGVRKYLRKDWKKILSKSLIKGTHWGEIEKKILLKSLSKCRKDYYWSHTRKILERFEDEERHSGRR